MGMSASQARMLSLTARLSDLEFSAQTISNAKITLSKASEEASNKYLDALDKQIITVKDADTSTYVDATAYNLTTYNAVSKLDKQRFIKSASGQVIVSQEMANAYESAKEKAKSYTSDSYDAKDGRTYDSQSTAAYYAMVNAGIDYCEGLGIDYTSLSSEEKFAYGFENHVKNISATQGISETEAEKQLTELFSGLEDGSEWFLNKFSNEDGQKYSYCEGYRGSDEYVSGSTVTGAVNYYENIFKEMEECGYMVVENDKLKDSEWLYEQLNNGNVFLSEWDSDAGKEGTGDFVDVSWSSGDSTLNTKSDQSAIARAEAEYETTMNQIQNKDKRYDMQLKQIDTEHNAIQTEMDSVSKVISKNIERTFKIFDA